MFHTKLLSTLISLEAKTVENLIILILCENGLNMARVDII